MADERESKVRCDAGYWTLTFIRYPSVRLGKRWHGPEHFDFAVPRVGVFMALRRTKNTGRRWRVRRG